MYERLERTSNGVPYDWELVGPAGARFMIYPEPHHTKYDIKKAKSILRNERDVISLSIADDLDLDRLYRAAIFRLPEIRPLKWYEINADNPKLIRQERLAGTSAIDYAEKWVLPISFVEQTRKNNLEKFGEAIFIY